MEKLEGDSEWGGWLGVSGDGPFGAVVEIGDGRKER